MTPRVYYNEIDKFAAQWLRNLMAEYPVLWRKRHKR